MSQKLSSPASNNKTSLRRVTRHTSHVTRHTSHVTRHTSSHVTRHTSHVTRHTSHVTRHTSPACYESQHLEALSGRQSMCWEKKVNTKSVWKFRIKRDTSHVTRHLSRAFDLRCACVRTQRSFIHLSATIV